MLCHESAAGMMMNYDDHRADHEGITPAPKAYPEWRGLSEPTALA